MRVEGNVQRVDTTSVQRSQGAPVISHDRIPEKSVREDTGLREENKKISQSEVIDGALDKINKTVRIFNRSIHFSKHEESGRLWVKVIDTETKKVIREIPPEEILEIVARLEEMVGLLVDERR